MWTYFGGGDPVALLKYGIVGFPYILKISKRRPARYDWADRAWNDLCP